MSPARPYSSKSMACIFLWYHHIQSNKARAEYKDKDQQHYNIKNVQISRKVIYDTMYPEISGSMTMENVK